MATVVVNLDVRHAPKTAALDEACAMLIVEDGDITSYAGELPENVTLYRPGEYVPPGMTIIVR